MRGFRSQKLAKEPARVRGYRTIRSGSHRVLLALLPGGRSRALKLFHPVRENPGRRHCSVCGSSEHDRRAHPVRRNVDGFQDEQGFHPIRGTRGYDRERADELTKWEKRGRLLAKQRERRERSER